MPTIMPMEVQSLPPALLSVPNVRPADATRTWKARFASAMATKERCLPRALARQLYLRYLPSAGGLFADAAEYRKDLSLYSSSVSQARVALDQ